MTPPIVKSYVGGFFTCKEPEGFIVFLLTLRLKYGTINNMKKMYLEGGKVLGPQSVGTEVSKEHIAAAMVTLFS